MGQTMVTVDYAIADGTPPTFDIKKVFLGFDKFQAM
jgi:hypothetical protein